MSYDEQLWKSVKNGDTGGFETLFRRYHQDLYRFGFKFCGNRQLVEDHIQDLFLKIWNSRNNLGDVTSVKAYLWTALRRNLITTMKKESRFIGGYQISAQESSFNLSTDEVALQSDGEFFQKKKLEEAILLLTPKQKEVLYLRFYEGMSYEEIEEIMSINYQVARNYMSRALKSLRDILISEGRVNIFFVTYFLLSGALFYY